MDKKDESKDSEDTLTTTGGTPVVDNQNSMTAGERGPILLQDVHLLEKMATFNRERIPERVVHAKGAGAHGTLTITHDITKYSKAKVFSKVGKKTDCFIRYSTVAGEKGSADTVRDVRGTAMKFYTEDGIWDLVGNNTPVFFIRDPLKFSDFIHTQKRDPQTNLRSPTMMWDFWSLVPETLHQVTILFSDRGIPKGYGHMNMYGSHTYSFINANDERFWVKFHFKTMQGIKNFMQEEADKLAGEDPDWSTRNLFEIIARGDFPKWEFKVQIMPELEAENYRWNPFDLTKIWPHKDYPLIDVGILELNKNPVNYFAEVEQAAFDPSNVVPGISFSPDKMLQGRIFSYADAHRYRLGVNYQKLPINKPKNVKVKTYHRDGYMRFDGNEGNAPVYEPNSFGGPKENPTYKEPPLKISGNADRYDQPTKDDDFVQPGNLYRLLPPDEQERLVNNMAGSIIQAPKNIQERILKNIRKADADWGNKVAKFLGL